MAKATLEYDLNDPDDSMSHLRAIQSLDMALALWEIVYNSKKSFEWQIADDKYKDQYELLDKIFEKIMDELNERGISVEKLIN